MESNLGSVRAVEGSYCWWFVLKLGGSVTSRIDFIPSSDRSVLRIRGSHRGGRKMGQKPNKQPTNLGRAQKREETGIEREETGSSIPKPCPYCALYPIFGYCNYA